jgi:hypothetical protein
MGISNKTLAVLLVFSMVVSLSGTMIFLSQGPAPGTGFATTSEDTGTVQYAIGASVAINFSTATINFGTGAVEGGYENCTLQTNGTDYGSDCIDFDNVHHGLILENIGNSDANVSIEFDSAAADFIGASSAFYFEANTDNESSACGAGLAYTTWESVVAYSNFTVCENFSSGTDAGYADDELEIDVKLVIDDQITGSSTATVTAYASLI